MRRRTAASRWLNAATFGDIAEVQVYSAVGDAVGIAKVAGRRVEVTFALASGGVGWLAGLPRGYSRRDGTCRGAGRASGFNLRAAPWKDVRGAPLDLRAQWRSLRADAQLTIGNATPGGGVLAEGTTVRVT